MEFSLKRHPKKNKRTKEEKKKSKNLGQPKHEK